MARESDSDLVNAREETLRIEPPVQLTIRFVDEAMQFHGHHLKRGHMLFLSIAAANRDPVANQNPDEFDLKRDNITHLSFGHGIHLCLGMSLARLEAKIALKKLFERFPNIVYAENRPQWGTNDFFRGLEKLTVKV